MKNKTLIQFFEWYVNPPEGLWNMVAAQAHHLVNLGITAVWLPPAYKGTRGAASEGYDVYDIYDLGEFDQKGTVATKYGTKEEYINAVKTLQQAGLEVYIDIVLNHMGGADETEKVKARKVNSDNRLEFTSEAIEIEAFTKFTFPGRNGKYSDFVWDHHCFTGVDYDNATGDTSIYSIINDYGEDWEALSHDEKGNFDFLMLSDIEFRNKAVKTELKKWIKWYYDTVPFDGLRLDAVKHISPHFFIQWIDFVKAEIKKDIFVLGEFWLSDDLGVLLNYLDVVNNRMSLFDAPLHHNLSDASNLHDQYDLRNIFNETLINTRPDLAVTFVDNHDTQPLQSLEEYTLQWFKPHGYAIILLREKGYPCVFFPDLYGTNYSGSNKDGMETSIQIPALEELPALLQLRKDFAYGEQTDYLDDAHCIGWVRHGVPEKQPSGCVVLLTNSSATKKQMHVGRRYAGKTFYDYLHKHADVVIDENGDGIFSIGEKTVGVWVPEQ